MRTNIRVSSSDTGMAWHISTWQVNEPPVGRPFGWQEEGRVNDEPPHASGIWSDSPSGRSAHQCQAGENSPSQAWIIQSTGWCQLGEPIRVFNKSIRSWVSFNRPSIDGMRPRTPRRSKFLHLHTLKIIMSLSPAEILYLVFVGTMM
jgi:hypothetical protein